MKQKRAQPKFYTSEKTSIRFDINNTVDIAIVIKQHETEIPDAIATWVLYRNVDSFNLVIHTSEESKFNALDKGCVITNVNNAIYLALKTGLGSEDSAIIGYEQPSLPLLVEMMEPLTVSLAKKAFISWHSYFEYEDLEQICNLCLCDLYNKGYYVHKSLLSRVFNQYIYHQMRINDHRGYEIVSLYKTTSVEDESLTIEQSIPDTAAIERAIDEAARKEAEDISDFEKDVIIELIGERRYNEIVRQKKFNSITPQTSKLLSQIKAGIDKQTIKELKEYIWKIR